MSKTPGQIAYEQELEVWPEYREGWKRPQWADLPRYAKESWEKHPTPRKKRPFVPSEFTNRIFERA